MPGVRCADMTLLSCAMPNRVSISEACRMASQSDLLPIRIATSGVDMLVAGGWWLVAGNNTAIPEADTCLPARLSLALRTVVSGFTRTSPLSRIAAYETRDSLSCRGSRGADAHRGAGAK